jgi:hypothetical protein
MLNLSKLRSADDTDVCGIWESIQEHCDDVAILAIVQKDCHLVDAALASDHLIASLDEQLRGHLRQLTAVIDALRSISWVNPAIAKEAAVEWLEKGAPDEKKRRLRMT